MGQEICPAVTSTIQLQTTLLPQIYQKYKNQPYEYILEIMRKYQNQNKQTWPINQSQTIYKEFLKELSSYYNNVPYHNLTHGFDVMIAIDKYMVQYKMKQQLEITDEQRVYILIAAYAHDNGHQGLTNNFYINSQSDLAVKYSYISPLQNMHSSNLLKLIREHKIIVKQSMRKLMIQLILATDNKHHNDLLKKIKKYQNLVNSRVIQQINEDSDKQHTGDIILQKVNENDHINSLREKQKQSRPVILQMMIHTADLNSCGKPLNQYIKWNQRLYQQFKNEQKKQIQYDYKNKMFSKLDPNNWQICVVNSNLSFLNLMVLPLFKQVSIIMPNFKYQLENSVKIRNYYQKFINQNDKKQKQLNKKKQNK